MAAKSVYKIPYGLDASYADMEIAIRTDDGLGFKPMPLRIILAYVGGAVACIWLILNSYVANGSVPQKIAFAVVWAMFLIILCKYDDTQRMQVTLVPTLFNYLPRASRVVMTRRQSPVNPFYQIVGIKDITDAGLIQWHDGSYGFMYRVVGSASVLLFEQDRNTILERVEGYYKKIPTDCEHIWITVKSSQAVYRQLAALKNLYKEMQERDPDLIACANEQFDTLKGYVGGSFRSIHQYLVLKAGSQEALMQAKAVLQSEVEYSNQMIKRCVPLRKADIEPVLKAIYTGKGGEE